MSKFLTITTLFIAVALGHAQIPVTDRSARIYGGVETTIQTVPWQVGIFKLLQSPALLVFYCGGSIISELWVLSAGHCFDADTEYSIHAGSGHIYNGGSFHSTSRVVHHPNFTTVGDKDFYDIALVEVTVPFHIDETRRPVPLYTGNDELPVDCLATVSGWGTTNNNNRYAHILNIVEVPIMNMSQCLGLIGSDNFTGFFCAGYAEGGKDGCTGDSGGPITVDGHHVGISSWGTLGCADPNSAGVYTETAYFYDWIKETAGLP